MRNNFAQQQNKRTKRSTVQTDFDPRQTLPSSAPLKKQSTTTNSGIYRNGLANTARNGSQTGTNFDPRQALPSTAAQKQQSVSANRSSYRSGLANAARNGSQTGTNFNTRQVLPPAAERQNVNANRSSYRSGVENAARAMAKRSETDFDPMQVLAPTAVEKRQHQNNYYTESYRGRLKNAALQTERPNEKFFDPASVLPSPAPEKRWDINVHDILYHDALERAARDGHWQSPTGRRSAEESSDRPSFGKLAFDSFAAGAGSVNRGVANRLGMMTDGIKEIERLFFNDDAFSGSLLDPTIGRFVDCVNTQADAVEKQAQRTAEDYGAVGPYVKGAIKGVTAALPTAIAAIGSGGASAAAQLSGANPTWQSQFLQWAKDLIKNPAVIANAVPKVGNAYRDDREKGIPINIATAHALTDGTISSILTAGTPDFWGKTIASKLSDSPAVQKYIADVHDSGASDAFEGILDRTTNRLAGSNDMGAWEILKPDEILADYISGTATEALTQTGSLIRDIEWEKAQRSANAKVSETLRAAGIRKPADNMDLSGYDAALANAGERQSWNLIYSDLLADSFPSATIRPQTGSYQSADFSGRTQTVGLDIPLDEAVRKENLTNLLWNEIEASVKGKAWSDLMNRIPHGDFQRLQQHPELRKAYQNAKYRTIKSAYQRSQKLPSGGMGARVNYQFIQDILKNYP